MESLTPYFGSEFLEVAKTDAVPYVQYLRDTDLYLIQQMTILKPLAM